MTDQSSSLVVKLKKKTEIGDRRFDILDWLTAGRPSMQCGRPDPPAGGSTRGIGKLKLEARCTTSSIDTPLPPLASDSMSCRAVTAVTLAASYLQFALLPTPLCSALDLDRLIGCFLHFVHFFFRFASGRTQTVIMPSPLCCIIITITTSSTKEEALVR